MTLLLAIDALIYQPDVYIPALIACLTVLGLVIEPLFRLGR
jgi:hypothetical protein